MDRLQAAATDHRDALVSFVATAQQVPPEEWNHAPADGKWSPAQVAEHLRLTYEMGRSELAGSEGFRIRTPWWKQRLFQWIYLPRILRRGRFPKGVPAVREVRPNVGPFDQSSQLTSLREEGERFVEDVSRSAGKARHVSHPFMGKLGLLDALIVTAQHIRHHHAQIPGGPPAPRVNAASG